MRVSDEEIAPLAKACYVAELNAPSSCEAEIEAIADVLRKAAEGWQPIETAPKDGRAVIGLVGHLVYRMHWQAYYKKWPHEEGGPTFTYGWSGESHDSFRPITPTHWMPLPVPPIAAVPVVGATTTQGAQS